MQGKKVPVSAWRSELGRNRRGEQECSAALALWKTPHDQHNSWAFDTFFISGGMSR